MNARKAGVPDERNDNCKRRRYDSTGLQKMSRPEFEGYAWLVGVVDVNAMQKEKEESV